ncbi:MAG: hypothetical protein WBA87_06290 [Microbacterium sp.]
MTTSSDSSPSAAARRATAAFVLVTALLAFGVGILVIIESTQQFVAGPASQATGSAWPYLLIVAPLMIIAVVVRRHLLGTGRKRR